MIVLIIFALLFVFFIGYVIGMFNGERMKEELIISEIVKKGEYQFGDNHVLSGNVDTDISNKKGGLNEKSYNVV